MKLSKNYREGYNNFRRCSETVLNLAKSYNNIVDMPKRFKDMSDGVAQALVDTQNGTDKFIF